MNLISRRTAEAFLQGRRLWTRNNRVVVQPNGASMLFLFGVLIAVRDPASGDIWMSCRDRPTRTTLNRLNAVLELAHSATRFCMRRGNLLRRVIHLDTAGYRPGFQGEWMTLEAPNPLLLLLRDPSPELMGIRFTLPLRGSQDELPAVMGGWTHLPGATPPPRPVEAVRIVSTRPPAGIRRAVVTVLPLP